MSLHYRFQDDLDLLNLEPPPMLIEGVLPQGGVMGITSYPGVGKTWLTLELLRACTTGTPFLGKFPVVDPMRVVFVGSDASTWDYARQWKRLRRGAAQNEFPLASFLLASNFMLDDAERVDELIEDVLQLDGRLKEVLDEQGRPHATHEVDANGIIVDGYEMRNAGAEVIIFDTLSRLCSADQNSNTEMENVFRNIRRIAEETEAAIVLLHHNAKRNEFNEGEDWRGAMSQIGALDSWLQLTKPKDRAATEAGVLVKAAWKKFRGITPNDFAFRMDVMSSETEARLVSASLPDTPEGNPVYAAVVKLVTEQPGLTRAAIRRVLEAGGTKLEGAKSWDNLLQGMKRKGLITAKLEGRENVYGPAEKPAQPNPAA